MSRWEQLLRFGALRLGRELGAEVQVALSRKEAADPSLRASAQTLSLVTAGILSGALRIPDAAAPLEVCADLRANRITVSAELDAPREGRAATRVGWLVRQLKDAPDGVRIDAFLTGTRSSTSELLRAVRDDPGVLVGDPKREFRVFRVTAASPLGPKRGTGRGGFIDSVLAAVDGFYASILQQLRPWTAKAPRLPKGGRTAAEEAGIDVTPPPNDLLEPGVAAEIAAAAPPDTAAPDAFVEGAEMAAASSTEEPPSGEEAEPPAPNDDGSAGAPPEIVTWEEAQVRLEHERSVGEVEGPIAAGGGQTGHAGGRDLLHPDRGEPADGPTAVTVDPHP